MSNLERWDIIVRFIDGPLAMQGDRTLLGPTVHVGANPGPDGLKMEGYRGLDDRQAVFTAYDGATVSIAPIGSLQVRVAPDEHSNWAEIHPIRGPVYLSNGDAIHFGPVGRGGTCIFIKAQRVGAWQQGAIASTANAATATGGPPRVPLPQVKKIKENKGMPFWFLPGIVGIFGFFSLSLGLIVVWGLYEKPELIGPTVDGYEYQDIRTDLDKIIEESTSDKFDITNSSYEGVDGAFEIFLMADNAKAAEWPELQKGKKLWDVKLLEWVKRSVGVFASYRNFWKRLDAVRGDYAYILGQLRKAHLPDVLAAIPYQESGYGAAKGANLVCAKGWWQFMPEIANQADIPIRNCKIQGLPGIWNPGKSPPIGVLKNAVYINRASSHYGCLIDSCEEDQRSDRDASTAGAIKLLGKAFNDPELRSSGSVVQIVIASHNAGYDNSPYLEGNRHNPVNLRWAYQKWRTLNNVKSARAADFIGANISCVTAQGGDSYDPNIKCGNTNVLGIETQHYVHLIIAQHLLAACYYGLNYGDENEFKEYRDFAVGDGYCRKFKVPLAEEVRK